MHALDRSKNPEEQFGRAAVDYGAVFQPFVPTGPQGPEFAGQSRHPTAGATRSGLLVVARNPVSAGLPNGGLAKWNLYCFVRRVRVFACHSIR